MNLTFQAKRPCKSGLASPERADLLAAHGWPGTPWGRDLGLSAKMPHNAAMQWSTPIRRIGPAALHDRQMTLTKPTFPAPDHDHDRCAADAIDHAEQVCKQRSQKF